MRNDRFDDVVHRDSEKATLRSARIEKAESCQEQEPPLG